MANLPESPVYDAGVYQLETTDAVVGGASGKSNAAAINLANRTAYLKQRVDALEIYQYIKHYASGVALPDTNIGPIWHDDYNSIMTWQAFTANGASYTGYASVLVGNLLLDTQPTPRAGYIKSGVANLSRTAYAALRGWAMHNGIMVAAGTWAAGTIAVKDNADGTTFTAFDVRGEFPRFWDDGRGVDSGRVFGTYQSHALQKHNHFLPTGTLSAGSGASIPDANWVTDQQININPSSGTTALTVDSSGVVEGAGNSGTQGNFSTETRPRNIALLACIKY